MTFGRSTLIAFLVLLLAGCARDASAPSPRSPQASGAMAGQARKVESSKVREEADRDSDGIPDPSDAMPASAAPEPSRGGKNDLAAPGPTTPPAAAPVAAKPEPPKDSARAGGTEPAHDRSMLIYTARITLAVYQVEQGLAAVEKIAKDMGGYLSLKRDREITIRVPRNRFEPTLAAVDKIGDVLHRDIQAQDVTDEFVDTEIRIKNARAMQVRLKALLEKAPVKEALEIEKELRRVTDEIELLEGKLKLLKDKIAYSTITVAFEPRGATLQSTKIKLPFPWLTSLGLPTLLQLSEER